MDIQNIIWPHVISIGCIDFNLVSDLQRINNISVFQNNNLNKLNNNVLIVIIDLLIKNNTPLEIINYTNLPSHEKWVALALIFQTVSNNLAV